MHMRDGDIHAPFWGGLGAYLTQMTSSIVLTAKRTVLAWMHVVWAIHRKNRPNGLTCMKDREKSRIVRKVTKRLYFTYLGRSPRWTDFNQSLHGGWCPRHNHAWQVSCWNSHGLRFYRGSNFPFSYWFLHGPYNSAAQRRCLWSVCVCQSFCVCVSLSVCRRSHGRISLSIFTKFDTKV